MGEEEIKKNPWTGKRQSHYESVLIKSGDDKGLIRNKHAAFAVWEASIEDAKALPKSKREDFIKTYNPSAGVLRVAGDNARLIEANELDPMTKLNKKENFLDYFTLALHELRRSKNQDQAVGEIRFDLDYFSWVNDILRAHALGDLYLEATGDILRGAKGVNPTKGDKAYRLGGDEFGAILRGSFTREEFLHAVDRIHTALSGTNILRRTLDKVLGSSRLREVDWSEKKEREGTVAIKEFLWGLSNLKNDVGGVRTEFIEGGRGKDEPKTEFAERLKFEDLNKYENYMNDHRVDSDLEKSEREERRELEVEAAGMLERIFSNLSVSAAGVYIDRNAIGDARIINKTVDALVYDVKAQGRGFYIAQVGLTGENISDRRHRNGAKFKGLDQRHKSA